MQDLINKLLKKNANELSIREASILIRYNTLSNTLSQDEVMEALQVELEYAKNSVANTTTTSGGASQFVPESVMVTDLIDLSDETDDYSFLSSFNAVQTLASKVTTVPILGRTGKAIVLPEAGNTVKFREAKDTLQSVNSDKITIEAKKLYNNAQITDELSNFSIIELDALLLGRVRTGILMSMADVVINADNTTGAGNNVNVHTDITVAADYETNPRYNYGKGLRAVGIAGGATSSLDVGTVAGADDIIDLQALVTSTRNPARKIILMDPQTYFKMMKTADFKEAFKNGRESTIYTGALSNIAGSDLFVTDLIPLTGADGKVKSSGNVKGTIIVVDVTCIQHGSYGTILTNAEKDFAVSEIFEAVGYWGMTNINGKGGKNFVAVGYNAS